MRIELKYEANLPFQYLQTLSSSYKPIERKLVPPCFLTFESTGSDNANSNLVLQSKQFCKNLQFQTWIWKKNIEMISIDKLQAVWVIRNMVKFKLVLFLIIIEVWHSFCFLIFGLFFHLFLSHKIFTGDLFLYFQKSISQTGFKRFLLLLALNLCLKKYILLNQRYFM
jgi:hypothetical protein